MNLNEFLSSLLEVKDDSELTDLCRKRVLHGTPYIFIGQEDKYYEFRKRISEKFEISFYEVYVTGSAKLGFSPHKKKYFDYESDIDVAIVSQKLYEKIINIIAIYQMELRRARRKVSLDELEMYHSFLEYTAIGWIRPDKLPVSFKIKEMKDEWFEFFKSISYGKSEVGNYKVSAGIFKSYEHFENYTLSGLKDLKQSLEVVKENAQAN
ncbi:MAG TPA: hypothetical protein VK203_26555 [Nostocaceae cyanobacterium]|nr:hypothetical protein [Nostocaceae cyanobacterium]